MRMIYLLKSIESTAKSLLRKRIFPVLILVVPAVFFIITDYTTTNMFFSLKLASLTGVVVDVSQKQVALLYISLTVTGLLSSFTSMVLIQSHRPEHKRLVICGFKPSEILLSKFILMMVLILIVSVYISVITLFYFSPQRIAEVTLGYMLIGFVYGSYGVLIGSVLKGELEGVLFITLIANLDVSWLQNPVFYAAAPHKIFIRSLPAFYPSQVSVVSAFSGERVTQSIVYSVLYGLIFLSVALLIYILRMRQNKHIFFP
ncbi:MAG: ABC transporter permease [Paludibacter sp.]